MENDIDIKIRTKTISFLIILSILLLGYFPAIIYPFANGDDFDTLYNSILEKSSAPLFFKNMRFIYALIGDIPFVLSGNDINNFWVLRIIYVFLLSASCFITYLTFTRIRNQPTYSLLLATNWFKPCFSGDDRLWVYVFCSSRHNLFCTCF